MKINDQKFGLRDGDLKIILSVIRQFSEVDSVLIFGSRAMGNYKIGSDIDIALKGKNAQAVTHKIFGQLNDESPLPYKFDIASYETSSSQMKDHIDQHGIVVFP